MKICVTGTSPRLASFVRLFCSLHQKHLWCKSKGNKVQKTTFAFKNMTVVICDSYLSEFDINPSLELFFLNQQNSSSPSGPHPPFVGQIQSVETLRALWSSLVTYFPQVVNGDPLTWPKMSPNHPRLEIFSCWSSLTIKYFFDTSLEAVFPCNLMQSVIDECSLTSLVVRQMFSVAPPTFYGGLQMA